MDPSKVRAIASQKGSDYNKTKFTLQSKEHLNRELTQDEKEMVREVLRESNGMFNQCWYIFENQVGSSDWWGALSWDACNSDQHERGGFSEETGFVEVESDRSQCFLEGSNGLSFPGQVCSKAFAIPKCRWDVDRAWGAHCDEDGWEYGTSFERLGTQADLAIALKRGGNTLVRRRRWLARIEHKVLLQGSLKVNEHGSDLRAESLYGVLWINSVNRLMMLNCYGSEREYLAGDSHNLHLLVLNISERCGKIVLTPEQRGFFIRGVPVDDKDDADIDSTMLNDLIGPSAELPVAALVAPPMWLYCTTGTLAAKNDWVSRQQVLRQLLPSVRGSKCTDCTDYTNYTDTDYTDTDYTDYTDTDYTDYSEAPPSPKFRLDTLSTEPAASIRRDVISPSPPRSVGGRGQYDQYDTQLSALGKDAFIQASFDPSANQSSANQLFCDGVGAFREATDVSTAGSAGCASTWQVMGRAAVCGLFERLFPENATALGRSSISGFPDFVFSSRGGLVSAAAAWTQGGSPPPPPPPLLVCIACRTYDVACSLQVASCTRKSRRTGKHSPMVVYNSDVDGR
jgi:hypothetical protein